MEQVESTVVEIAERSLEFCLLYLEKSSYACDDFGLLVSSFVLILIEGDVYCGHTKFTLL